MMTDAEFEPELRHYIQQAATRKQLRLADVDDLRMSHLQAGAMKHEAHIIDQQYKIVARHVNMNMPPQLKYTLGGIVPHLGKVKNQLEYAGLRLDYDDLVRTVLYPQGSVIDLSGSNSDDEEAGTEHARSHNTHESGVKCVYVKDPLDTLVRPEIEDVLNLFPSCGELILNPTASPWKREGTPVVDFVLHVDNTSLETATGATESYECAVIRQILPGLDSAQQSHFSCIPLFVFEGDEKYEYIQSMFAKLLGGSGNDGLLKDWVDVETNAGEKHRVKIEWHLCSDMKLILIVLGLKAGGTFPCFKCQWNKQMGLQGPCSDRKPDDVMSCIIQRFTPVLAIDSKVSFFQICVPCNAIPMPSASVPCEYVNFEASAELCACSFRP